MVSFSPPWKARFIFQFLVYGVERITAIVSITMHLKQAQCRPEPGKLNCKILRTWSDLSRTIFFRLHASVRLERTDEHHFLHWKSVALGGAGGGVSGVARGLQSAPAGSGVGAGLTTSPTLRFRPADKLPSPVLGTWRSCMTASRHFLHII